MTETSWKMNTHTLVYSAETPESPSLNCTIHTGEDGWNKVFTGHYEEKSVASTNTLISIKAYR